MYKILKDYLMYFHLMSFCTLHHKKNFKNIGRADVQSIVANIEISNISDSSKREYDVG
jgi:hypothetical protein